MSIDLWIGNLRIVIIRDVKHMYAILMNVRIVSKSVNYHTKIVRIYVPPFVMIR